MNTRFTVSLLLPFLAASLSAQRLELETSFFPDSLEATVHGARDGSLVVLVLGLRETTIKLPGGQLLGVEPDLATGFVVARGGPASTRVRLAKIANEIACFAQGVAVDPDMPLDEPGAIEVSAVKGLRIPPSPADR